MLYVWHSIMVQQKLTPTNDMSQALRPSGQLYGWKRVMYRRVSSQFVAEPFIAVYECRYLWNEPMIDPPNFILRVPAVDCLPRLGKDGKFLRS